MEDPYVSQLERKYRAWEKTWEIKREVKPQE